MDGFDNFIENFNDVNTQNTFNAADVQKNKVIAVIPYFLPILFFLPAVCDGNSAFCKFHSNQQLTWLITCIVLGVVSAILGIIPVLGVLLRAVLYLAIVSIAVILAYGTIKGKALRLPFIGSLLKIF